MRIRWLAVLTGGLVALSSVAPVSARAITITATVDGHPVKVADLDRFYCHDFAYPQMTCFRQARHLEAAIAAPQMQRTSELEPAVAMAAPVGTWVTVYRDASYAGTYAYLSRNYDNLGDIGWNDTITSFRVHVSFGGRFQQHTYSGGWQFDWCCNYTYSNVGSTFNDQFSSFYRN